jgi:hypothetical protein
MMAFSSLTAKLIKIIVIKVYMLKKMVVNGQKGQGGRG